MKLLTGMFILSFSFAALAKVDVRVAELSTVRLGETIRLGHVSQGLEKDMEASSKLYNTVISEAFNDEGPHEISSSQIAIALRNKLSVQDLNQMSLKLPEVVKINVQRNFVSMSDLKQQILMQAWEGCKPCDPSLDDLKMPNLSSKEEILETRLDVSQIRGPGGFLVPLVFETSKGRAQHWITGRLSIQKEAPVAKRLISIGQKITTSDYEMKKVNLTFTRDGIPTHVEIQGKVAARPMMMGQVIYQASLKKESAIERGQIVKVIFGNSEFEIQSSGIAEQSGAVGDLIRFKIQETNKMLSGILVEKGVVKVE